jgi:hypothetical protein
LCAKCLSFLVFYAIGNGFANNTKEISMIGMSRLQYMAFKYEDFEASISSCEVTCSTTNGALAEQYFYYFVKLIKITKNR